MYTARARYALLVVFIIAAGVCLFYEQYQLATVAAFLFCFVLYTHFKQGSVLLASRHFKNGDYSRAEKALNEVSNPDRLAKSRRGYYEFMRANIALQREDFDSAEFHFQIASRFPLGGKNDKAFVLIHLANLALRKKDGERARAYIGRAKELAVSKRAQEILRIIEKEANEIT